MSAVLTNLRMADFVYHPQYPFGRREGSEDRLMLHNRIIQHPIPMESLPLVHPMAQDLVLQVRIWTIWI